MKKNRIIIFLLLHTVVAILYYLASTIVLFKPKEVPLTILDNFVKPHFLAVWIYASFYLLLFLVVYLSEKKDMILFVKLIILNSIISFLIFISYPTIINHNEYFILQETSPISFKALTFIKEIDVKSNCFPSLHIANSLLAIIFLFRLKSKFITTISCIWFLFMAWSVLSTEQHYFYDIIGGIVLTILTYFIGSYYLKDKD